MLVECTIEAINQDKDYLAKEEQMKAKRLWNKQNGDDNFVELTTRHERSSRY